MSPNPYMMSKIAEHKQQEIARSRGMRNWQSIFRGSRS